MSEHRGPRRPSICNWPYNCSCHTTWLAWEKRFAEGWHEQPHDAFMLICAVDSMRLMLECVTLNCPDKEVRLHAMVQLMHPVWKKQIEAPCCGREPERGQ